MGKLFNVFKRGNQVDEFSPDLPAEHETPKARGTRRSYANRILFNAPDDYKPVPALKQLYNAALTVILSAVLILQPIMIELAQAQVITDPKAPIQFRAGVTTSGNGTPLVNIVTPSFGGVSHNKFQSYDIDTRGVILNNSALGGTSVIGGTVSGNPNLVGSAPARIIVNEVTSSSASVLNGPTEVFGTSADVVVANPNGISCISCSFINAGRTTLTTGVPNPDYNTGAISYTVTRGTISISGTGLNGGNAPLGNIDLIGRQIEINGPVSGSGDLRIRAGALQYDQSSDTATVIAGAPAVTGPAVSSSAAGTITAGSVSVLSQDVNLGVNLAGDITTLNGSLSVQSAGDVTLNNVTSAADIAVQAQGAANFTGTAQATGRISANGNDITVGAGATLSATDAIVLEALNSINSAGTLQSGSDTSLTASGAVTTSGIIQAGGQAALEGDTVTANSLSVYGTDVTIIGRSAVTLNETALSADGTIRVMAPDITLGQNTGFKTDGQISLDAKHDFYTDSVLNYPNLVLTVKDDLTIGSHGALVEDDINYTLTGTLDVAGQIYGRNSTTLAAANLINEITGEIYGPDVTLNVSNKISNLGLIVADDTLSAVAASLENGAGGEIYATDTTVTVSSSLSNLGAILSDDTLQVLANGATVTNDGILKANGDVTVTAASYTANTASAVLAGANLAVTISGSVVNDGRILTPGALTLTTASLDNQVDATIYGGGVAITLGGDLTNAGKILSGADLTVDTGSAVINNSGAILANGTVSLATSAYTGASAAVIGGDIVIVTATNAIDNSGRIVADNLLLMRAATLTNQASGSIQSLEIGLALSGDITNAGTIAAIDTLNLTAGNLANSGTIAAAEISRPDPANVGQLASGITLTGNLFNSGSIQTSNNLLIAANGITNASGATIQGAAIDLTLPSTLTNNGTISASGLLSLRTGDIANSGTSTATATISGGDLQIIANGAAVNNGAYGLIEGNNSTHIRAATTNLDLFHNNTLAQGQFEYGHTFILNLSNQGLTIGAGQSLIVDGDLVFTLGGDVSIMGTLASKNSLTLHTAGSILIGSSDPTNPGGAEVFTRGDADISADGDITNNASIVQSLGSMLIQTGGTLTNTRTIQSTTTILFNPSLYIDPESAYQYTGSEWKYTDIVTTTAETSQAAEITAGINLVIRAGAVTNDASTIYAGNLLTIQANTVNNISRDTGVWVKTIKTGGDTNIGKIFYDGWTDDMPVSTASHLATTAAMIGNAGFVANVGSFTGTGITSGAIVVINAQTLTNGITDPNRFTAPNRLPDPVIDLSHYFSGPNAGGVSGPGVSGPVTVGNITYLHAAPISGGADERGPGWILNQVGDTRGDLTFFADPTTEQSLINKALIDQTGRALLDPNYKDAAGQQEALYQGTVNYLEQHPDVHLGDELTDAQKAAVNQPIIWYHNETIDGQTVLTPEVILPQDQLANWTKTNGGVISGDNIYLSADFIHNTGSILANQDLTIQAGTLLNEQRVATMGGTDEFWGNLRVDSLQTGGVISGSNVNIFTAGDLYDIGGSILADQNLSIFTGGDLVIAGQTIQTHLEDNNKHNGVVVDDTVHSGGTILSGGSATLIAGGDIDVIGSTIHANDDLTLASIVGDLNIVSSVDVTDHTVIEDGVRDRNIHVTNVGSDIGAGGDLTLVAADGDITLQASHLAGDAISISAADAIHFATGTDQDIFVETGKSSNGITETHYNNGHTSENLVYDTMDIGEGGLTVKAAQIIVDYLQTIQQATQDKKGNEVIESSVTQSPMDAINQVLANPGMEWLNQIVHDGSLNLSFDGQTITNSSWDHDQTTLTPAAAAIIALIVSVVTGGTLGPLIAEAFAAVFGTSTLVTAIATGVTAFISSTISGTLIGAINGDLDMGHVLMNALAAGLTAGILSGVNDLLFSQTGLFGPSADVVLKPVGRIFNGMGGSVGDVFTPQVLVSTAIKIGVDSAISAGIRAALLGENFGDDFVSSLKFNAVNDFIEPVGFHLVGGMHLGAGRLDNVLAHAVVGAIGGYIVGGIRGLEGGALGAALGELALSAQDINANDTTAVQNMMAVQQLIGGLASFAVGDVSMAGVDAALSGFIYNGLADTVKLTASPGVSPNLAKNAYKFAEACFRTGVCTVGGISGTVTYINGVAEVVITGAVGAAALVVVLTAGAGYVQYQNGGTIGDAFNDSLEKLSYEQGKIIYELAYGHRPEPSPWYENTDATAKQSNSGTATQPSTPTTGDPGQCGGGDCDDDGSPNKPVTVDPDWKPANIFDEQSRSGCEACATQIQKHVGGEIIDITPTDPSDNSLGRFNGKNWGWKHHTVVVNNGRVYDMFTGSQGMPIDQYKGLWQYSSDIKFGF